MVKMSFELDDFDVQGIKNMDRKYKVDNRVDLGNPEKYRIRKTLMRMVG